MTSSSRPGVVCRAIARTPRYAPSGRPPHDLMCLVIATVFLHPRLSVAAFTAVRDGRSLAAILLQAGVNPAPNERTEKTEPAPLFAIRSLHKKPIVGCIF